MADAIKLGVGPDLVADGSEVPARAGKTGEAVVAQAHGRYNEAASRNLIFSAANQAAQAVSVALATTYTGILVYNPPGSGKYLSILKVKYALSVAPAAIATIGLLGGWAATGGVTAQTTPLTRQNTNIGNTGAGVGIPLSAATIVTPTWLFQLWDGFTAAALPAPQMPVDLEGLFTVQPGGFIGIGALTAVTGLGALVWEEIPIV